MQVPQVSFGEWVSANIVSLIALILTAGGIIYRMGQLGQRVKELEGEAGDRIIEHEKRDTEQRRISQRLANHIADTDKHVNHLYMQSIKETLVKNDARIDRLETTMSGQFEKVNNKLDQIARKQ